MNNDKLNILWTNGDVITSEKMVFMYGINSKLKGWWKDVTIILWGAPNLSLVESEILQEKVKQALQVGVKISACKACADQLGTSEALIEMGIEVVYWGEGLTEILKEDGKILTI